MEAALAVATEAALAVATEAALAGRISAGTLAALVTPAWLVPHSIAIILSAIDLRSIDLPSGTDFSIIGSLDLGLPLWATLTVTTTAATRAYGRHGDGAGGTSATDSDRRNANYFNSVSGTS
jgi:hypothetical protein